MCKAKTYEQFGVTFADIDGRVFILRDDAIAHEEEAVEAVRRKALEEVKRRINSAINGEIEQSVVIGMVNALNIIAQMLTEVTR
jgi:hypothetical protein